MISKSECGHQVNEWLSRADKVEVVLNESREMVNSADEYGVWRRAGRR